MFAVQHDSNVDQARSLRAKFFRIHAVRCKEARTLICEEHVRGLKKLVEGFAILRIVSQDGRTHADLHIEKERIFLGVVGAPDVQYIGAILGEVPADRGSGDDVSHAEGSNPIQRATPVRFEGHRFAVADLFHLYKRQVRKDFRVLCLLKEFFVRADHAHDKARLRRGIFKLFAVPLQNGIANRFGAVTASQEIEGARSQPGVHVQGEDMATIPCLVKERQLHERVVLVRSVGGWTTIQQFPFAFEEATKTPQRFSYVDSDVLAFAGAKLPNSRCRDGLGCQTDGGHRAEADRAGKDGVTAIEGQVAAAIPPVHADIGEDFIDATVQIDGSIRCRVGQLALQRVRQPVRSGAGRCAFYNYGHMQTLVRDIPCYAKPTFWRRARAPRITRFSASASSSTERPLSCACTPAMTLFFRASSTSGSARDFMIPCRGGIRCSMKWSMPPAPPPRCHCRLCPMTPQRKPGP